jgi:MFS family permease
MGSQLTPDGCEATVIALNAGSFNLAMVLSSYVGSYMLSSFGIKPRGEPGESMMFSNLWKAQAFAAIAPLILLAVLPLLIPAATATDRLITTEQRSATYRSPHERLFGRRRELPAP